MEPNPSISVSSWFKVLFAFIVTAHGGSFSTGASYGIDFIDEYDARCFLFGLTEQVADAGSTYADKHFHKVGTGQ